MNDMGATELLIMEYVTGATLMAVLLPPPKLEAPPARDEATDGGTDVFEGIMIIFLDCLLFTHMPTTIKTSANNIIPKITHIHVLPSSFFSSMTTTSGSGVGIGVGVDIILVLFYTTYNIFLHLEPPLIRFAVSYAAA